MSLTNEIQAAVGKMQVLKYHSPVVENIMPLDISCEMDVMSISKSGMIYEFEVKISRSDFKAELNKRKWEHYNDPQPNTCPNYFSYVCPTGLILAYEITDVSGLYYYRDSGELIEVKKPKVIHKGKSNLKRIIEKCCRLMSERHFLGCARLTYENNLVKEFNKKRNN